MSDSLFSQGMIEFYNVFRENMGTSKDWAERFKFAVPKVADVMNIGRLDVCLKAFSNSYELEEENNSGTVYVCEYGYDEEGLVFKYTNGDIGLISIVVYPRTGYKWSEPEKENISAFAFNLYILGSRFKLMDMIHESLVKDNLTGLDNISGFMKYVSEMSYKVGLEKYHGIRFNIKNYGKMIQSISKIKGNDVMRYYGNVIKDFVGNEGRVARLGGDNFVAIIKDIKKDDFINFISEIPINLEGVKKMKFCGRVGVYDIQPKNNISEVMNYIDEALSAGKALGKDVVAYEELAQEI